MKEDIMSQLYLCEEPYWSKYDQSDICGKPLQINVISDGKCYPILHLKLSPKVNLGHNNKTCAI